MDKIDLAITIKQLEARKKQLEKMIKFGKNSDAVAYCNITNLTISEEENIAIDFIYLEFAFLSELTAINKTLKKLKSFEYE